MTRTIVTTAITSAAMLIGSQSAFAQSGGSSESMSNLLKRGFEIRAAAPNGNKFVVFMQKNEAAYACEFVTVNNTRCGAINKGTE